MVRLISYQSDLGRHSPCKEIMHPFIFSLIIYFFLSLQIYTCAYFSTYNFKTLIFKLQTPSPTPSVASCGLSDDNESTFKPRRSFKKAQNQSDVTDGPCDKK